MEGEEEQQATKGPANDVSSSAATTSSSKVTLDGEALRQLGSSITPKIWDDVKNFTVQEQRFDSLRSIISTKLTQLSKPITNGTKEWMDMDVTRKAMLIAEIQECIYDLQLVEHASQASLLDVAKTVFSLNKKRCICKVIAVKTKPAKKQKLESALSSRDARKVEREQKSPPISKSIMHSEGNNNSSQSSLNQKDELPASNTNGVAKRGGPKGQRKSNREKLAMAAKKEQNPSSPASMNMDGEPEKNGKEEVYGTNNSDGSGEVPTASNIHMDSEMNNKREQASDYQKNMDEPSCSAQQYDPILSSPPRKRAAAVAAAMSVADTINPRSSSPRKKNNGNNNADDDVNDINEPTYCLCEQVSFGDMICCDFSKCPVEWFHFSCVNIKIKPKGKKWFCPLCRGDKPTVLKSSLVSKR